MDKKKIKIISSILEGRKKAVDSYNEYKCLSYNKPEFISINYNLLISKKYDDFRVKLYNYMNAIKNKKVYFEKFNCIDEKLNYIPEGVKNKNLYLLFKAFRHKNEHPENVEYDDDYIMFKEYITLKDLEDLLEVCNDTLGYELEKMNNDAILQIFLSNPDLKSGARVFYNKLLETSKFKDESYPQLYDYNQEIINKLLNVDFCNLTLESLDKIMENLKEYINNISIKEITQTLMSKETYEQFERFNSLTEDITIEEFKLELEKLINLMNNDKKIGVSQ